MKRLLVLVVACASSNSSPPQAPLPPEEPQQAGVACVPAGLYTVTVDLAPAQITQVNTGMDSTEWCESMLKAVPAAQLRTMRIGYANGVLEVRWPPSRRVHATERSGCAIEITDEPIPATISFAGGRGEGTVTYSLGTVNHPDEKCTATGAKLVVERAGE